MNKFIFFADHIINTAIIETMYLKTLSDDYDAPYLICIGPLDDLGEDFSHTESFDKRLDCANRFQELRKLLCES